jgi:hypothetical protein
MPADFADAADKKIQNRLCTGYKIAPGKVSGAINFYSYFQKQLLNNYSTRSQYFLSKSIG